MVEKLLGKRPNTTTLSHALHTAVGVQAPAPRMALCKLIVRASKSNLGEGKALVKAVRETDPDVDLVRLLLTKPLDDAILSDALNFALAVRPRATRMALCKLIVRASASNLAEGMVLDAVVLEPNLDLDLIRLLLEKPLDAATLSGTLKLALNVRPRSTRMTFCELLIGASASNISEGEDLVVVIREVDPDLDLVRLFLTKPLHAGTLSKALEASLGVQPRTTRMALSQLILEVSAPGTVGENKGLATVSGESAPDLKLIRLLLSRIPSDIAAKSNAFEVAFSRQTRADWLVLCELLLEESSGSIGKRTALTRLAEESDVDLELIHLLLRKGVLVDYKGGQALVTAIKRGNTELFQTLVQGTKLPIAPATISRCFDLAMVLPLGSLRMEITTVPLSYGVDPETRVRNLIHAVRSRDVPLLESMVTPGEVNWHLAGDALSFAVTHGYVAETAALVRGKTSESLLATSREAALDSLLVTVLEALINTGRLDSPECVQTGTILLNLGLPREVLTSTLLSVCQNAATDLPVDFIGLLVDRGADPMVDNERCFISAAAKNDLFCVERLTSCSFDLDVVVGTLIHCIDDETRLVKWIDLCLQRSDNLRLQDHSLLRLAIERFPSGTAILRQLVENGCEPMLEYSCKDENGDDTTLLIWALAEVGRASDDILLELLDQPLGRPTPLHINGGIHASTVLTIAACSISRSTLHRSRR